MKTPKGVVLVKQMGSQNVQQTPPNFDEHVREMKQYVNEKIDSLKATVKDSTVKLTRVSEPVKPRAEVKKSTDHRPKPSNARKKRRNPASRATEQKRNHEK